MVEIQLEKSHPHIVKAIDMSAFIYLFLQLKVVSIELLFQRLAETVLQMKESNCSFFEKRVNFFVYTV